LYLPRLGRINASVRRERGAWAIELDAEHDATARWLSGVRQQCEDRLAASWGSPSARCCPTSAGMIMPLLTLPLIKGDTVAARRRLGRGLCLAFQVAGQGGELRLGTGTLPTGVEALCFDTACGVLAFR
jgi:hypothetical protein